MEIKWRQISAAIMLPMIIFTLTLKLANAAINSQGNEKDNIQENEREKEIEMLMNLSLEELLNIEIIHTEKKTATTPAIPKITGASDTPGTDFSSWTFSLALGSRHGWLKRWQGIMFPRRQRFFFLSEL
ncbi:MAG: hypothetical protein MUF15_04495 [Acidobacteria bacterium]|jgi:hypothetical protein|nr:hypothetical protein [Acidobacteriota bacterium]